MIGLGTIINVAGIAAGGIFGLLFGKKLGAQCQNTLMKAMGLCTVFLGMAGTFEEMLQIREGGLSTSGTMMMIGCFAIGALIGEALNIEGRIEQFGEWLKKKTKSEGDEGFVNAFVVASLTVCIGAMAVIGSIKDGIYGDYSILAAKAVLDLIIIMVMTASMGKGCIFSAIPVAIFQGTITLLSRFVEPIMTAQAMSNLSLTGSMLIFCIGANLVWGKSIPVGNLLPTIFLAVGWAFLPFG